MVENKGTIFGIIALIIGASGLGLGTFSIVNFQVVEGPQGPPGEDGQDGQDGQDGIDGKDAPGTIIVGILEPDQNEVISGNITIRALIAGSDEYNISILQNGSEIGTSIPLEWDPQINGWYNITVIAKDIMTSMTDQDTVLIRVLKSWNYQTYSNWTLETITRTVSSFQEFHHIDFDIDFTGNFEVFFQGNIYCQSGQRYLFLNLRLDGTLGAYYYFLIENDNLDYYIYIKDVFRNIGPGHHRASIYWAEGNYQPATFVLYRLAKIGIAPII